MNKTNELIQWLGTFFILAMYVVMNVFPERILYIQLMGLLGATAFFTWTIRVRNYPQMLINGVAIALCCLGLFQQIG